MSARFIAVTTTLIIGIALFSTDPAIYGQEGQHDEHSQAVSAEHSGEVAEDHHGEAVEEDDDALVIEAMKMETPIYIPCDGTVKEINVSVGDEVEEDDLLAVIDN